MGMVNRELCHASFAYAAVWESEIEHASIWPVLRKSVVAHFGMKGRAYWILDLYEERAFSVAEVREVIRRLDEDAGTGKHLNLVREKLGAVFSDIGLDWPKSLVFRNWMPRGGGRLTERILRLFKNRATEVEFPTITREADFEAFLKMEGFDTAFVRFWRIPPKNRNNHLTRALVSIAASIAFLGRFESEDELDSLDHLLREHYHSTPQTVEDIVSLVRMFAGVRHDPAELACRLRSDASIPDMTQLIRLIEPIRRIGVRSNVAQRPLSEAEKLFSNLVCEGLEV